MLSPIPVPMSAPLLISLAFTLSLSLASPAQRALPEGHPPLPPWFSDHGHNEPYFPNPLHPVPGKLPLKIDEKLHYYEPHQNNDEYGKYKRSPCPAVNTLANRGYIPRSGKHVGYAEIAQASRDVFNFGDDNVSIPNRGRDAGQQCPTKKSMSSYNFDPPHSKDYRPLISSHR